MSNSQFSGKGCCGSISYKFSEEFIKSILDEDNTYSAINKIVQVFVIAMINAVNLYC